MSAIKPAAAQLKLQNGIPPVGLEGPARLKVELHPFSACEQAAVRLVRKIRALGTTRKRRKVLGK